jgi:hypothetical protein
MTAHRLINTALFCAILGMYALMANLDGPSDHQAQADQLADLEAAVKLDNAKARLTKAIAALCGQNASAILLDDTTVQCVTKRGHKTQRVAL